MRYKIYLKDKKIAQTNDRMEAHRIYVKELMRLMDEQKYPLYIHDSVTKEKIT